LKNLLEVYEAVKFSRENISKITQPCFILQSTHDHIISKNSLEIIYNGIGSKIKKKLYIKKAYHTFISDIKNEHVFRDILNFLEEN
jgi:esterase/lipase